MALYAFDGTGNDDKPDTEEGGFDSNVLAFFRAYGDPDKDFNETQDTGSLYLNGIGQRAKTKPGSVLSKALGLGGHRRLGIMVNRLEANREVGDTTVDVIGFSRGAALAVSFANDVARKFPDVSIRFMGLFDVVGQFGLPGTHLNAGHELSLPKNVKICRHAMALDEGRSLFPLTRLCDDTGKPADSLVEVWFRGVHSDVGGGNGNRGLNWLALHWMYLNAKRAGLPIDDAAIAANLADQGLPRQIRDHKLELTKKRTFFATDCLHSSVQLVEGVAGRPHNNPSMPLRRMNDDGEFVTT